MRERRSCLTACPGVLAALAVGVLVLLPGAARAQGRSGADTEEEQTFQAAEAAFKANNYEEAGPLYDKVITLNSSRGDAYIKRSVIFYKQKKYAEAVSLLQKGQQARPDDLAIRAQLGLSLYKSGAIDIAVSMMEEVVQRDSQAYQVQLQLGQHYLKSGDGKRASIAFDTYFKHRPEEAAVADLQIRPLAGSAYLVNRQYAEAQREFELVLQQKPDDLGTRILLATTFAAAGDCTRAVPLFEGVAKQAPQQPAIYYNLGSCYLRVGRRAEAERNAESYTKARPQDLKGFVLLGDARLQGRDYNGALVALQAAAKLDENNTGVQARLGRVYIAQKSYPQAVAVLEKARKANEADVEVLTQLTEVYALTRSGERALLLKMVADLMKATDNADALTAAGVAAFVAGDDAQAEKAFAAALGADARAVRPRSGLQMTLNRAASKAVAAGDLGGAEALLVRAQKIDAESVPTNRNLGLVLLLEKKYVEAEKALGLALRKVPRDLIVNRLVGRLYVAVGRKPEAVKAYEAAEAVAQAARGTLLAQVYVELGPAYADVGKLDRAIEVLEVAQKEAGASPALAQAAQRNLTLALYKRGMERSGDPRTVESAFDDLSRAASSRAGLAAREQAAIDCALGVAALKANKLPQAQEALGRAAKTGCQFAPPYDKVGLEFFTAYAQYRGAADPARREAAGKAFQKLLPRTSGAFSDTVRDLVRSSYELQGFDLYTRGDGKKAAVALKAAAKVPSRGERRTLDHNLAVLDLADGKLAPAERAFDALGQKPPEALLNLGIVRDRQGDPRKALELYRRAADRGVRAPRLREWIDVKERLLSSGATAER